MAPHSRVKFLLTAVALAAMPLSIANAQNYSRTQNIEYHDNLSKWVLGQQARIQINGVTVEESTYDENAQVVALKAFGKLQQTMTYHSDGTLASVKDGNNNTTVFSNWKRGVPQTTGFADGSGMSAQVDDSGWITAVVDQMGSRTCYGYDAMGRISSITYPSESVGGTCDTSKWYATNSSFVPVGGDEFGLPAGHWRQSTTTGNAVKISYYDALWRPVVVQQYDAGNQAATTSLQRFTYDHEGRVTFASYPGTSLSSTGTWTNYDALGRVTSVGQDTELDPSLQLTTTSYLSGGRVQVTNPRGQSTITSYMAYDQPTTEWPVKIESPESTVTEIARDIFGKPTAITRRNADGSQSVTRQYVYAWDQSLCKSIEPEAGATVYFNDDAGNLLWSAGGLNLFSAVDCNFSEAQSSGRVVSRAYDARNRLKSLSFPDGNGNQAWTYWPDGKVKQVTTSNGGVATYNSFTYNKRRLLVGESQGQADGETWAIGYGYDANGALATHRYPSGQVVDYAPNALGQPTRVGTYATAVSYYPNGAIKQFTYGNGIVHTMSQNARQLPSISQDAYGGNAVLSDGYNYDANGNVVAISDGASGRNQRGKRNMSYDGLDRLTVATSPMFDTASYGYDALDNLTHVVASGRDHYYCYDAYWRLTNVRTGGCGASGTSVIGLAYDPQGNLSNKNGQGFVFDYGNRLREATGKERYRYDAFGRRTLSTHNLGTIGSMYDQAGVLRYQKNRREAKTIEYMMLGGSLVAEVDWPLTSSQAARDYVNWGAVNGAARYVVEESVDGVTWTSVYEGSDVAWTSLARPSGSYTYRVQSCDANGACATVANVSHVQRSAVNIVPMLYQILLN
ncbi:RHS repeat domain-containing protein [Pseudoxanthomonas winnipegensis]|uniref:RHS repeat domain-containing protein n=1 Tax=Pseudoxanthomonas winnipegensis TaxID=2480810 RepID=UPI00197E8B3D|nr:RHS repeat protein [Pseudoxanthomonas winnipegensis]